MNISVLGISHKTADIALREKVVFAKSELAEALDSLISRSGISEAVIISTCNRTEIYCATLQPSEIFDWLVQYKHIDSGQLIDACYTFQDLLAVEHLMRVASGLDSMVLGEPQILGQIKACFAEACLSASIGQHLSRLFRQVFSVAKRVRTSTAIGACPVSVASTAIAKVQQYLKKNNQSLSTSRVMVVGAGATGELVAKYCRSENPKKLIIAGRTQERAYKLAAQVNGAAITLQELSSYLDNMDVVISATASQEPVITVLHTECFGSGRPYLLVDLAVPRDIDSRLSQLDNITLITIDDLKDTIQDNVDTRAHAATKAHAMIETLAREYMMSLQSLQADDVVRRFRQQVEILCQEASEKALKSYQQGEAIEAVLSEYSSRVARRLMHVPAIQLRQASAEGRPELLALVNELFDLKEVG